MAFPTEAGSRPSSERDQGAGSRLSSEAQNTGSRQLFEQDDEAGRRPPSAAQDTETKPLSNRDEQAGSNLPSERDQDAGSRSPFERDVVDGSRAQSEDQTVRSRSPSERHEECESKPPPEDQTAGSRLPSEDQTAGSRPPSEDQTAGSRPPSEDQTAGSRLPTEDQTAGSRPPSEDQTAESRPPSEDQTAGSRLPSEDQTAGSRPPPEDQTAVSRPPSEQDVVTGSKPPSEDQTARSRPSSKDQTARSGPPSEDQTAVSRPPSEQDVVTGSKPPSEDETGVSNDTEPVAQYPISEKMDNLSRNHLRVLMRAIQNNDNQCPIPEHGNEKLIAYCIHPDCQKPICTNCSMIRHKDHRTENIRDIASDKRTNLVKLKQRLVFHQEKFSDAVKSARDEKAAFEEHVISKEREMIKKQEQNQDIISSHKSILKAVTDRIIALIRENKQNILDDLEKWSDKPRGEEAFIEDVLRLTDILTDKNPDPLRVVLIWMLLNRLVKDLEGGAEQESTETSAVCPLKIVKKRIILPRLDSVVVQGLKILNNLKVGIEETQLRKCFHLEADQELLHFQGILPITETEALVLCKQCPFVTSVVLYRKVDESASFSEQGPPQRHTIHLKEKGQYSFAAAPGNSLVATLCQAAGHKEKNQVLFWSGMLNNNLEQLAACPPGGKGKTEAEEKLNVIAETALPPRDVAITQNNCFVVLTAMDPPARDSPSRDKCGDGGSVDACVLLMTPHGAVLKSKTITYSSSTAGNNCAELYSSRRVSVSINGDIYVTNGGEDPAIIVLSGDLTQVRFTIRDPYDDREMNERFSPTDICHDDFGRLIIADNRNHAVVRIEVEDRELTVNEPSRWWRPAQVILKDGCDGVENLTHPSRLALGPGRKLWVACRENLQVFDYMHTG